MLRWGGRHMHHCEHFFVLETIEILCTNYYHHLLSLPAHPAQALLASARSSFSPISSACSYSLLIQPHFWSSYSVHARHQQLLSSRHTTVIRKAPSCKDFFVQGSAFLQQ